ncbi:MAG: hypothetical protein Q8O39_01605, partial [bacterium]|nr:hypothetical protein [bacterium]
SKTPTMGVFDFSLLGSGGRIRTYNLMLTSYPIISNGDGLSHHPSSIKMMRGARRFVPIKRNYSLSG